MLKKALVTHHINKHNTNMGYKLSGTQEDTKYSQLNSMKSGSALLYFRGSFAHINSVN